MAQAQCPNCGGYKVSTENSASIGKATHPRPILVWLVVILLLLPLAWWFVFLIVLSIFIITIPLTLWLARTTMSALTQLINRINGYVEQSQSYRLKCDLCGYMWTWRTDEPYPKIRVKPDLISKGEQKLEEERRKQQEDAAALYYLTHQGKK